MTIAAVLAFALSRLVFVPLPLWTVLTAVILTQVTFGRSVKATLDYLAGTVGGTIYAGGVSLLILHANDFFAGRHPGDRRSAYGLPGSRHAELQRGSFHRRVGDPGSGNGKLCYLSRGVDPEGKVLESVVTAKQDKAAALRFLKRIMKKYDRPWSVVTDGLCSYPASMKEIGVTDHQEVGRRARRIRTAERSSLGVFWAGLA